MLKKDIKTIVYWPDVDPDFFDTVAGVLLGDILAQFLFLSEKIKACHNDDDDDFY